MFLVSDDDDDGFQQVKDKRSRKQKNLAQKILRGTKSILLILMQHSSTSSDLLELFSDSTLKESEPQTTASADKTDEAEPVNLDDDEEEKIRLDNVDSLMIPLRNTSRNDREKQEASINYEQIETIRKLLNTRNSVWTDEKVKNISDFRNLNKGERQQLYRYWLKRNLEILRSTSESFSVTQNDR